jgi:hypothetical protein
MINANDNAMISPSAERLDANLPADAAARLLRQMLDALLDHRLARADTQADDKIVPLMFALALKPQPPRWIQQMEAAARDGVEQSLLASIREEGWRAFAEGRLDAMRALADRACGDDARLLTIVDHQWDGIGSRSCGHWIC